MPHRCAFGCAATDVVMHVFPNPEKFPERFRVWVGLVGSRLESLSDHEIYNKKRICDIHFVNEHRNRFKRLSALAVPSLHLPRYSTNPKYTFSERRPMQQLQNCPTNTPSTIVSSPIPSTSASLSDNCSGSNVQQESVLESAPREKGTKAENINLMNDESQDYNDVEYPEEDVYDNADLFENIRLSDDYRIHNVKPKIETYEQDSSMDEIDNLFASYSVTFRKLPSTMQTLLKIDLAKLFARYEMKNAVLQCSSDKQQQAKDNTPSITLLEKTKTTEKREFPTEILTHSKNTMPKSRRSNRNTEVAINKFSSKKHPVLNNKSIIKKRVSDTKDTNNIVLHTNDLYQKPMKVRKLEEDYVDADTSRRLSNCQYSQGTSAILITDRPRKKLTIESDEVSQTGLPTFPVILG